MRYLAIDVNTYNWIKEQFLETPFGSTQRFLMGGGERCDRAYISGVSIIEAPWPPTPEKLKEN